MYQIDYTFKLQSFLNEVQLTFRSVLHVARELLYIKNMKTRNGSRKVFWILLLTTGTLLGGIWFSRFDPLPLPSESTVVIPPISTVRVPLIEAPARPHPASSPLPPQISSKMAGGCFTATYKHQAAPKASLSHRSKEECVQHRNGLKLPPQIERTSLNSKSLCVKVDGKPVAYEWADIGGPLKSVIAFGPLAGPRSSVQLTFGTYGVRCNEPCVVPRDSFLDALGAGGASGGADEGNAVSDDPEIRAELGPELITAMGMGHDLALFQGWAVESMKEMTQ